MPSLPKKIAAAKAVSSVAQAAPAVAPKAAAKTPAVPAKTPAAAAPAKPVAKPPARTNAAEDKPAKAKKPKLVRDSFTIPKTEYAVLDDLKQRSARLARPMKKSELLRAGIKALAALPDAAFLAALQAVPAIKTGRPKASA